MKTRSTALALAAGLLAHGTALAQSAERPWYVGLTQDFTRDSNVFGTATGETGDTISTTSLQAGLNQTFGRQRVRLDGTVSHQRYDKVSERDNNGYSLGATLDWSTVERLSGNVRFNSQRRQSDFRASGLTPVSLSNIERSDDLNATVRLGLVTMLAIEAGAGHRKVNFSASEFAAREYKQDSANLSLVYRPNAILSLSLGGSAADTKYQGPELGQTENDSSKRRDVFLSANWVPTGASVIDARLAYTTTEYRLARLADFDGVTGSLGWAWNPTGLLTVNTTLVRDSGQESGFRITPGSTTTEATDFSQVTDRVAIGTSYELTGKVRLQTDLSYARRQFVDIVGLRGRENSTSFMVGARWAATRTVSLGCNLSRESRSGSGATAAEFDTNRFGCSASLTLD
jgi:Putative beta-barrel porin 2